MTDTATDLPPLKNAERWQHLEVDTFCVECGYNLHGQPVERDERLGIFICRCPECGRFHPAGTGLTATRPWMHRLAMALLVLWILFVLHAIFWIVMGMGVFAVLHTSEFVNQKPVTMEGEPAEWLAFGGGSQVVRKGTTQPINHYRLIYTLAKQTDASRWFWDRRKQLDWWVFGAVTGMAAGVGLMAGVLLVIFLWHWRRRGYWLTLLLPIAIAGALICYFALNDMYEEIFWWAVRVALGYALLEAMFMLIGIKIGRPVARGLLRMFVPPKPRQHFAFLWHVDGKTPPQAAG